MKITEEPLLEETVIVIEVCLSFNTGTDV